jgi:ESCRT-I complex subunit VPS28
MRQLLIPIRLPRSRLQSILTRYVQRLFPYDQLSQGAHAYTYGQEVKLATNNFERELYESLAEIYSIIITLDAIEKAYLKDSIAETEYGETCSRLLKQYKSHLQDETVAQNFVDLETFMRKWDVSAAAQLHNRLTYQC